VELRCLIVDDNEAFLTSACRLLASQGVDVLGGVSSSAEAVSRAVSLQPDVVLVDVQLGEEDGLALAVRLASEAPSATVILISTHTEDELAELIAASPAVGFLAKSDLGAEAIATLLVPAACTGPGADA
jgi:DNA-binding NarL/FixJ family response regulator